MFNCSFRSHCRHRRCLCKVTAQYGIRVGFSSFQNGLNGCYITDRKGPIILLASSLQNDHRRLRSILAEEFGHFCISAGHGFTMHQHYNYSNRLDLSREEFRALKWGAEYLITLDELQQAFQKGAYTLWELANYFEVTEAFMRFRLNLPDIKKAGCF